MPLYIGCPFYQKDNERTIYCEGCSHFWWTREKQEKFLRKTCEKNYTKCDYYKDLTKKYEEVENLPPLEQKLEMYKFYNQHLKKEVKKVKGILTKSEQIAGKNIATKQREIERCHDLVREARVRANEVTSEKQELIMILMALMSTTGTREIDFEELVEMAKLQDLKFKVTEKGIEISDM